MLAQQIRSQENGEVPRFSFCPAAWIHIYIYIFQKIYVLSMFDLYGKRPLKKLFPGIEMSKFQYIWYCLLPIAYCLFHIAYCLVPIAYCLMIAWWLPLSLQVTHLGEKGVVGGRPHRESHRHRCRGPLGGKEGGGDKLGWENTQILNKAPAKAYKRKPQQTRQK